LISFQSFLKRGKQPKSWTEENFKTMIYSWKNLCELDSSLYTLLNKQKYDACLENLFDNMICAIDDPVHGIQNGKYPYDMWIKFLDLKMDYFRLMMIDMIRLNSKENAWKLPVRLNKKTSGVGIDAFIRISESNIIDFKKTQQNLLQNSNTDKKFTKEVKDLFSKLTFIRQETKTQVLSQELLHRRDYHAELLWMTYQGNTFLKKLNEVVSPHEKPNIHLMDTNWVTHLSVFPRIEFVLSSSCCVTCQQYFKDLRQHLNQNNIFVPIVIYSDMPTNNNEVSKSQMNLILFDGTFIATGIYIDTPYDSKADRKAFDFFKPIQPERAEVCEEVMSEALAYINIHQHAEYQKQLLTGLEKIFLDKKNINQSDLAWLRTFLVRWPEGFYENQNALYAKVVDAIESGCQVANNENMPSLIDLKQQLKTQVYAWIHESFEDDIEGIDEMVDETIDEAFNEPSYHDCIWAQVFPLLLMMVIYLMVIKIKEKTMASHQLSVQSM
jgi:hypothetical protein